MRLLFTFIGGMGHFIPLISVARAAQAAGHTVAFGCSPSMVDLVAAEGFTVLPLGSGPAYKPERKPLRPLDTGREEREFRDHFARRGAKNRTPLTLDLCQEWKPDVLVCEETDFGSMIAAEKLEVPYAVVLVMAAGSFVRFEVVGGALNDLRAEYGLPPDPELAMLHRYLVLSSFPPGFRDPAFPLPNTAFSFRPDFPQAIPISPAWATVLPGAPVIYFTLGTIFNLESGDLFNRVLAGLREMTLNVLVTVGRFIDPAEFGPQPAHIHLAQYVPQVDILPYCDLVISHGGSGSVAGAFAYGLPQLLIPMGADQPHNAARCQELGAGRMLDPVKTTAVDIQKALSTMLSDPAYSKAAARLRDEYNTLLPVPHTIPLLENL